jgi:hypothetical protein
LSNSDQALPKHPRLKSEQDGYDWRELDRWFTQIDRLLKATPDSPNAVNLFTGQQAGFVLNSLYDAYSILMASVDDTPIAITIGQQTVIGRLTGGAIKALTVTELTTLINAGTESLKGALLLASTAEAVTGTNTSKAVTAAGLTAHMAAPKPIGSTTPNTIQGWNKEVYIAASRSLTALECSGTIVSNYGMTDADCIGDLPAAAEGLAFICTLPTVRARYFRLRCPSAQADKINLLTAGVWVAGSDDGYVGVASGYAGNSAISMYCAKVTDGSFEWFAIPLSGTWGAG